MTEYTGIKKSVNIIPFSCFEKKIKEGFRLVGLFLHCHTLNSSSLVLRLGLGVEVKDETLYSE